MRIGPINPVGSAGSLNKISSASGASEAGEVGGSSFGQIMNKSLGEVNRLQTQADQSTVKLASGGIEDVHQAMIDMQKAKLALDLTIQVRNKVIEAYQEIMRMQV